MNHSSRSKRRSSRKQSQRPPWRQACTAAVSFCLLAGIAEGSRPASYWTVTDGDFYEATMWTAGLPNATNDAVIDNKGVATISTGGHDDIAYVFLGSQQNTGGTLNVTTGGVASFTTMVVGALNATGNLNITGGGKLTTFGGPIGSDYLGVGKAIVSGAGSSWKVTGSEMVIGGNGTGTLTMINGGNFNVGNGTGRIQLANHPVSEGNLVFGDGGPSGTVTAGEIYNGEGRGTVIFNHTSSSFNFATKLTGIKTLNGYLNVLHQGTGTTLMSGLSELAGSTKTVNGQTVNVPSFTVAAGKVLVTGSITGSLADIIEDGMIIGQEKSVGEIEVLPAGTLGGTGSIEGKTTVGGTLAPGIAVGVLTFGGDLSLKSTATTIFELGGHVRKTGYDGLDVAGGVAYGGTLRIVLLAGFTPNPGEVFDLFQGFTGSTGNFANIEFSSASYTGSFNPVTGDLSVVAIPEPTTFGLVTLGIVSVGLSRRCRPSRQLTS